MTLNLMIPQTMHTDFSPRITVIGVGGGGTNAVDNMIAMNLQGVEFVVANTDAQQLIHSKADRRIQLGPHLTGGLGAGAKPAVGRAAAEEAAEELERQLEGSHMVFITAGMGGGTGTGAAPVIARMAKERNILTVGVVTKPFTFEGARRARAAEEGIAELSQHVDTLIIIPNQNIFRMANERTTWKEAFKMADNVLYMGVRGVTDLMMAPGLVNLDFADIRTVMAEMGKAMMGTGEAEGEGRAIRAAEAAISNPLLEDTSMEGAQGLLINITGGEDLTLFEVDQAATRIKEEVDDNANIIFGSAVDESLNGRIRVSVVATGIRSLQEERLAPPLMVVGGGRVDPVATPVPQVAPRVAPPISLVPPMPMTEPAPAQSLMEPAPGTEAEAMEPASLPRTAPPPMPPMAPPMAASMAPAMAPPVQQRPVPPMPPLRPRQQPEAEPGLFSDPGPGEPAPAPEMSAGHAPSGHAPSGHAPSSQSSTANLFTRVTGLFRGKPGAAAPASARSRDDVPAAAPAQEVRAEPRAEPRAEQRPTVRPGSSNEELMEIPAFLRRQNS